MYVNKMIMHFLKIPISMYYKIVFFQEIGLGNMISLSAPSRTSTKKRNSRIFKYLNVSE